MVGVHLGYGDAPVRASQSAVQEELKRFDDNKSTVKAGMIQSALANGEGPEAIGRIDKELGDNRQKIIDDAAMQQGRESALSLAAALEALGPEGAAIGAVAGAILGKSTSNHKKKRLVWGAAIGAIAGTAIGHYMDKQEQAFRQELSGSGIDVIREGDNLRLIMPANITFARGQSYISSGFHATLNDVAVVLNKFDKTLLSIEGLGRQLYSDLDLWNTAKPYLEKWLKQQIGVKGLLRNLSHQAPYIAEKLPELPNLIVDILRLTKREKQTQSTRPLSENNKTSNWSGPAFGFTLGVGSALLFYFLTSGSLIWV